MVHIGSTVKFEDAPFHSVMGLTIPTVYFGEVVSVNSENVEAQVRTDCGRTFFVPIEKLQPQT